MSYIKTTLFLCLSIFLLTKENVNAQTQLTFSYTGTQQIWTVPNCVFSVTMDCFGAEGVAVANEFHPALGGEASGVLAVTPGQTYYIYVGGQSGWNGGGLGQNGANGGDASDVRFGGNALANRIIVAGGGGGAGGDSWSCFTDSGNGGKGWRVQANCIGGGGGAGYGGCGRDGDTLGGTGYAGNCYGGGGGGGGFLSGGGGATATCGSYTAQSGSLGLGGAAYSSPYCVSEGAGGGGGGYCGGGGSVGYQCGAGQGGGGSSWTGTLTHPYFREGQAPGNGQVLITFVADTVTTVTGHVITNVSCNGTNNGIASAITTGGISSTFTYSWIPSGGSKDTASGLSAGNYTVTVNGPCGGSLSASVTITQPTTLTVTASVLVNVSCNGGYNGVVSATVGGGTAPYSYNWNPSNQTSATISGISAGCYTVTVKDTHGCSATSSVCITQPMAITAIISGVNNISCNGGNNGSATVKAGGGVSPYTYLWTPTGETNAMATGLTVGCYTVLVNDMHGCSATSDICVTQPAAMVTTTSSTGDTGLCTGSAMVSVTGGQSPYNYLWSNGGTTSMINNVCHGTYCCTITDHSGCLDTACVPVSTCSNNFNEPICIITLDTATNNCQLIWGRTNSPPSGGYGHYNVYKDTNNTDVLIHSQPLNVLSEYTDPTSNPSLGAVSYKISTFDSCGESALSPVHTSIYLTTTASLNVYMLNWTAYVGFTPTKYIIYRGPSLSTLLPIDSVANNVFTYHDTLPPLGSYYVIEAESYHGPCIPSAHKPNNISLLSGSFSNGFNTGTLLGINNIGNNLSGLKVYPNPSSGMFTLSYSMSNSDNVGISIMNELGQEVYTEQKRSNTGRNTEQLNIENLASGIYTLRMQTSTGTSVSKLLIMRNK